MNADSAFHIGTTHTVCQDYAVAGLCERGRPYVVLSDGCSSSPDTDIGARLLVKAAELQLRETGAPPARGLAELHKEAARLALLWAEMLGLKPQAVDATLLTAHLDGEELIVGCSGDGVVCLQTNEGGLDVYSIAYPDGYPGYPAYAHQPARLQVLAARARKEVTRLRAASTDERMETTHVLNSDELTEVFAFDAAEYRFTALFSDGVQSFLRTEEAEAVGRSETVPLESILPELLSFKNTRGAFVGRRMKMFLKDCRRKGWRHADDFSLAALHLGG